MAEIYRPGAIFSVGTHGELWKKTIFDKWVRNCRQDHSRSSKLVPTERPCVNFYWHVKKSKVKQAVSCIAHRREHASNALPLPVRRRWSLLVSIYMFTKTKLGLWRHMNLCHIAITKRAFSYYWHNIFHKCITDLKDQTSVEWDCVTDIPLCSWQMYDEYLYHSLAEYTNWLLLYTMTANRNQSSVWSSTWPPAEK